MNAQAGSGRSLSLYLMVVSKLCNRSWDVDEHVDESWEGDGTSCLRFKW